MEASGQHQMSVASEKKSWVSFGYEVEWAKESVQTWCWREKSLALSFNPAPTSSFSPNMYFCNYPLYFLLKKYNLKFLLKKKKWFYLYCLKFTFFAFFLSLLQMFFQQLLFIHFQFNTLLLVLTTYLKSTENEHNNYPFWYSENGRQDNRSWRK